ncbi:MAG: hypothetical protein U5L11_12575 [Arhodomonas sp.]|nr:hypothetical protein [Arhodomonas sp.]
MPDEVRGDEVIACVVAAEPVSADRREERAAAIVDYCAGPAGLRQGAGLRGLCRRAAADRHQQAPAWRAQGPGCRLCPGSPAAWTPAA